MSTTAAQIITDKKHYPTTADNVNPGKAPKPAAFPPRDAAGWNNIHTRYFEDALNGAGYTKAADRIIAMAIWNASGCRPVFPLTNETIAVHCGKSVDWVNTHMPDFIRRRLEMRDGLIRRISVGRDGVASQWSVEGMITFINELHAARPRNREDHAREGQRIAGDLQISEKEAARELAKIEARKRRIKLAQANKAETSATEYLTRACERIAAKVAEKAGLFSLTPEEEIQAYKDGLAPIFERLQALELERLQTVETATLVHDPCTTRGDEPDVQTVEITVWNASDERPEEDRERKNLGMPSRISSFTVIPSDASHLSHRPGWNPAFNGDNLNARLRDLAAERGINRNRMMPCPLHDDETPSVHVTDNGDRIRMLCFSCGKNGKAILDAIDGGIVPVPVPTPGVREPSTGDAKQPRIIATYIYRDVEGDPVYKVLRTDPKGFPTMRYDAAQERYVNGLDGTARILYRLPELLSADPAETVFVVEGEKSANLLAKNGFVVTAIGGANAFNPETMVEPLRNRRVIVLPDNDGPGDDVAFGITLALWGVAARTSVVQLPGLGHKEDVADWLTTHGHTADELRALVSEID